MEQNLNRAEKEVWELLKTVYDPELLVNIVDLGLVYAIRVNQDQNIIEADITLTSPGCPLSEMILEAVREVICCNFPELKVYVNLVWEPPWSSEMITAEGLRMLSS